MNIRKLKKAAPRVDVRYLSTLRIKGYGANNIYPQQARAILNASSTGAECCDRYARFIEGGGFNSDLLWQLVVNGRGDTLDELLAQVCQDIAFYGGFALHVDYNLEGKVAAVQHVPFETCRLEEDDDSGYIAHIVTHPDWTETKTRNGKPLRVRESTVTRYDVFNATPVVVQEQIMAAGGIANYKGQILWVSNAGRNIYPLPKYDRILTDLSTDEGLSNIKFRNSRCNFLSAGMVITKRGQSNDFVGDSDAFANDIANFQGDETANLLMGVTLDYDEEKPEIVEFPTKNFDKDFQVTDRSVVERIYCAFEQEPFLCIRNGKLGFSGTVVQDTYNYYASLVSKEQRLIERSFAKVFGNWYEPLPSADFSIKPLSYISTVETDE